MFSPLGELEGRNGGGGASAMVIENVNSTPKSPKGGLAVA
jgi:hypothetical protein